MTAKQKHSGSRIWRFLRRFLYLAGVLVAILGLLRLSLMTSPVQRWVKNSIVSAANQRLSSTLSIDRLEGDLWEEADFSGIRLVESGGDTLASVDTLAVRYDLLSWFSQVFEINEVKVIGPYAQLAEKNGEWNVTEWAKPVAANSVVPSAGEPFQFRIGNFRVSRGRVDASLASLGKDSAFVADQISVESSLGYYGDDFDIQLRDFSLQLLNTRLNESVRLQTSARANGQTVTLDRLLVATGQSVIKSSGTFNTADTTASLSVQTEPLAWQDLLAFMDSVPLKQNFRSDISLQGNLKAFRLGVSLETDGISGMNVAGDIEWDSLLVLKGVDLSAERLSLRELMEDASMPVVNMLEFKARGDVPLASYRQGELRGTVSSGRILAGDYGISSLSSDFTYGAGRVEYKMTARRGSQRAEGEIKVDDIWKDLPSVEVALDGRNIDPASWLGDEQYSGNVAFQLQAKGRGFYPGSRAWDYDLKVGESRVAGQRIRSAQLRGKVSQTLLSTDAQLLIDKSRLRLQAEAREWQSSPKFNYKLQSDNLDLSEIAWTDSLTSSLKGTIEGEGSGNSLASLALNSTVRIDSSVVNGEFIRLFTADIEVRDTVATVRDVTLNSTIATGSFNARLHLVRWYDRQNVLTLDLQLEDVGALAPIIGASELRAEGSLQGELVPREDETLQFTGTLSLVDVLYGGWFKASSVEGSIDAWIKRKPEYTVDFNLESPEFSTVLLQDLNLKTSGKIADEAADGDFEMVFRSTGEGVITHSGTYSIGPDTVNIMTARYDITTSLRTLSLVQPFETRLLLANRSVSIDTARLASGDGAYLEFAVPYADSVRQRGFLRGRDLDLGVIQQTLLGEAYFEGVLSGNLYIDKDRSDMMASGDLTITAPSYKGTQIESLTLKGNINDKTFNGTLQLLDGGREIVTGEARLPFELGDPSTFGEAFFERPVEGHLRVNRVALSNYRGILRDAGIQNTEGVLLFDGILSGNAGDPEFTASLDLVEPVLSGIEVDSVSANLSYIHERSTLNLDASISSLRQQAARITADLPFRIDMKTFGVSAPTESDQITVNIVTNRFNLAAINDFVNRNRVRDIQGQLDGRLTISGYSNDLKTEGELRLTRGSMQVAQAGIRLEEIRSTAIFEPDRLRLSEFSMKSGSGRLQAQGIVALEQLVPGNVNIRVQASNFRAANTSDYSAIIDLNTRIGGTVTRPRVTGTLSLRNGFIQLRNFGEKSVENVELDPGLNPADYSFAVYDSLSLDMDVSFNRRFFVRNQRYLELEVELDGQVDLLKEEGKELQVFGTLNSSSGYARPLGKRFVLEQGQLTFTGDPTNPQINIRTLYEPPQPEEPIKIWYIIENTVEDPRFKYESNPPMELENIISYTLFGQPFYALDSWKQVVASSGTGTTAADVALDVLMDRVESLATQRLGIDVVKIENTRVGGDTGTSITTGWYINPKVFFAIQNVITGTTPDTGFLLEYMIRNNLKLIISQGNDNRQGVDLKWNFEY